MDVAALAQTIISSRVQNQVQDAQVGLLKKTMDQQAAAATQLIDKMLPTATEGSLGRNVNMYA